MTLAKHLLGPFYPNHPKRHAPRGHPRADVWDGETCPRCGSALVWAEDWIWCFNHDHPDEPWMVEMTGKPPRKGPKGNIGIWYICGYERRIE